MSTVALPHGSWEELVQEIRHQHPSIAERVLTGSGGVASGFALVVNDEVVNGGCLPPHLSPGDELYLIPTFAGG
jgi:molybdopterin converting factor small subunit